MGAEGRVVVVFGGAGREPIVTAVADAGHRVVEVVVPARRSPRLDAAVATLRSRFPLREVARDQLDDVLDGHDGATLLSVGFPYLLPAEVLARYAVAVNVHPTLLPRYRGPTTGAYVIANGEQESGSTVHVLDEGMDTGPVVAQSRVALTRFDTVRSLQRKVYGSEPALVVEALARLAAPGFTPTPQDAGQATTYPKRRTPEDSAIDPSRPLVELFDEIRACDPDDFPAHFEVDGQRVYVKLWRADRPVGEEDLL